MYFTTTVKLVTDESSSQPLAGVHVALYDRDTFTRDDLLGTQVTDGHGEARFEYTSDNFVDADDRMTGQMPDLYVVVYDADNRKVLSTREDVINNTPQKSITVRVDRDLATRHGLIVGA